MCDVRFVVPAPTDDMAVSRFALTTEEEKLQLNSGRTNKGVAKIFRDNMYLSLKDESQNFEHFDCV